MRWGVRFLTIVCLIGLLLSVAISSKTSVKAYSNTCISPDTLPTVTGTPIIPTADKPSVVFNEVLPSPRFGWNCAYQTSPGAIQSAWIELYNLTDQSLNLYNQICVDTGSDTISACLSFGSVIPAHGFLTFFPSQLSANFVIKGGSNLRLLLASVPVDQVTIPALPYDVSYARIPDGTGKWQPDTNPTINTSNALITSPSPTPTRLHKKQETKSKVTTEGKKKQARNTGSGSTNTTLRATTGTAINEHPGIQNDTGKQTQWHNLQFPSSLASPSALNTIEDRHSASPPIPTENIPQTILFSLMGIAGLISLWWGWRYFFKKRL